MKTNTKVSRPETNTTTHEGGPAVKTSAEKELFRTVATCMLFEDRFYEKGADVAQRIVELCKKVSIKTICDIAKVARTDLKLRHAPLFLMCVALAKKGTPEERNMVGQTISEVIQRADELAEIFAIYRKIGGKKTPRQLKAGVAKAFPKFNEYNLAKYNRANEWKLRDALFLSHAKPQSEEQAELWQKLINNTLATPDTWETELSAGKDKKGTFERLLKEQKLGYMALLRNLRNMSESGVDEDLVNKAILEGAENSMALPFRFVAAANAAPGFANSLSDGLCKSLDKQDKLDGKTLILVDVSGSMGTLLSGKSEMQLVDAASALAVLVREITPKARVIAFGTTATEVKSFRGLAMVDAIRGKGSECGGGTNIGGAVAYGLKVMPDVERVIIITDMQSYSVPSLPKGVKGYYLNIAPYEASMPTNHGQWTVLSGFSERVIDWMRQEERQEA